MQCGKKKQAAHSNHTTELLINQSINAKLVSGMLTANGYWSDSTKIDKML